MPAFEITPFRSDDIPAAAALFAGDMVALLRSAPVLAPELSNRETVAALLANLGKRSSGLAARLNGRLVGYFGWYILPDFRGAGQLAAYVPEWAHSSQAEDQSRIYQALYSDASRLWTDQGCQVHAITQLAHNEAERDLWFWNGFGLLVVDAVRPMEPLEGSSSTPLTIRKADLGDAEILHTLDIEHRQHYIQPPILMAPREVTSPEAFAEFIHRPENAVWMACDGLEPVGFIRFDAYEVEAARLLEGEGMAFISGAYVRPAYRQQGAARAMLNAALVDFAARGYRRCVLDFESFNPQARSFWLRYFQPVAYSLMRIPEATG